MAMFCHAGDADMGMRKGEVGGRGDINVCKCVF